MFDSVVFLATAWGPLHGGINSFNYDLARGLHRVTESNVVVVVPKASNPSTADGDPKILVTNGDPTALKVEDAEDVLRVLAGLADDHTLWIGHDLKSGEVALACRDHAGGKALIIHHMNYEAYGTRKHGDGAKTAARSEAQSRLLGAADHVAATGPRLARSAKRRLHLFGNQCDVVEIIPGLANIPPRKEPPEDFFAITFGRLTDEDDRIKMGRLAVAAFGRFVRTHNHTALRDPTIYVIGVGEAPDIQERRTNALIKLASDEAQRTVNVQPIPFITDRDLLFNYIANSSVCMMLSVHEGFGLAGWEAIAAGVPLIVTRQSGLYDFLYAEGKSPAAGCFFPVSVRGPREGPTKDGRESPLDKEDIDDVAEMLSEIYRDPARAKEGAIYLREQMSIYTWENAATRLARRYDIKLPTPQIKVGLACGFPDADLYGSADEQIVDDAQTTYRICWDSVSTELGVTLARYPDAEVEIHHSGVGGGSLAERIIEVFAREVGTDRVVTQWHKEFATEDEAQAEICKTFPDHYRAHNVSSARPYVNKVGTVVHVSTMARRRYKLVSEVDALIVAAGHFAVRELAEHAIERGLPIAVVGFAGGAGLEMASEIAVSNEKVIKTFDHREIIESLANPHITEGEIPSVVNHAINALCQSVVESHDLEAI